VKREREREREPAASSPPPHLFHLSTSLPRGHPPPLPLYTLPPARSRLFIRDRTLLRPGSPFIRGLPRPPPPSLLLPVIPPVRSYRALFFSRLSSFRVALFGTGATKERSTDRPTDRPSDQATDQATGWPAGRQTDRPVQANCCTMENIALAGTIFNYYATAGQPGFGTRKRR